MSQLLLNIWSLESILRYKLLVDDEDVLDDLFNSKIGDKVDVNKFTNYLQLTSLIDEYNSRINGVKLDKDSIISIRDLIHHGRYFLRPNQMDKGVLLIKCSAEDGNGKVFVVNKINLLDADTWIDQSNKLIRESVEQIEREDSGKLIKIKK